jgi:hypothetical protein
MKLSFVVGEETVGLVTSVVLGAKSPVNVWEYGLLFEVYCAEDTAAYFGFPSSDREVEKKGVYQLLVHL